MKTTEADDQATLFRWAEAHATYHKPNIPELALLKGSLKAKKKGMKKGFPDISLFVPRGGYHGLFIELKIKPYRNHNNKMVYPVVSAEQKWWINQLNIQGYKAVICKGCDVAMIEILDYLKLREVI